MFFLKYWFYKSDISLMIPQVLYLVSGYSLIGTFFSLANCIIGSINLGFAFGLIKITSGTRLSKTLMVSPTPGFILFISFIPNLDAISFTSSIPLNIVVDCTSILFVFISGK